MSKEEPRLSIRADHGSIAAGGNVTIGCSVRPCPICEERLIDGDAIACRHCRHAARKDQAQQDGTMLLGLIALCTMLGGWLVALLGQPIDWPLAFVLGVLVLGLGWYGYMRLLVWAQCDAGRQLHALWRWLVGARI